MAEADRYLFELKEVAEVLVQKQDLQEGYWGIYVEFGLGAANIPVGPDAKTLVPASLNFVQKLGIQKFKEPNNLTVDAAEINRKAARKGAAKKGAIKQARKK